jgi:hypothetical protein
MCVLTSILNHGLTHPTLKWIDRIVIAVGFLIDMYITTQLPSPWNHMCSSILVLAVALFFIAKRKISQGKSGDRFHASAHFFATGVHCIMLAVITPQM